MYFVVISTTLVSHQESVKKEGFQSKRGKNRRTIFDQYNINRHSYKSQDKSEHAFAQKKSAFKILVQYVKFKTVSRMH
jgi:hypothetical protein